MAHKALLNNQDTLDTLLPIIFCGKVSPNYRLTSIGQHLNYKLSLALKVLLRDHLFDRLDFTGIYEFVWRQDLDQLFLEVCEVSNFRH